MRLNFDKHLLKTWRYALNHPGRVVLVMRKRGYLWMVRSIVIAKDQLVASIHEVIALLLSIQASQRRAQELKECQA